MSELDLLRDARLVWAMACDCNCKACQALDVVIRRILGYTPTEVAQILCDNSPRCDEHCDHTSTGESK